MNYKFSYLRGLIIGIFLLVSCFMPGKASAQSGIDFGNWSEDFVWLLLNFSPGEEERYEQGILELAPVVIPEGNYVLGNNNFFGHPGKIKGSGTFLDTVPQL